MSKDNMQTPENIAEQKPFLWRVLEFVKFSHTVFALPFAMVSMLVAARGIPSPKIILGILVCMVGARTAAMAFNRLADWEIDKRNPRTAQRSRLITKFSAQALIFLSIIIFIGGCFMLNLLCVMLSPLAIALVFFYSITKRFTAYSHFFLGLALSVAPVGAWIAVQGSANSVLPFLVAAATLLWVFGFDLIYALQDMEFDSKEGLYSFPAKYGMNVTLRTSMLLHITAFLILGILGWVGGFSWPYWLAWFGIGVGLAVEQSWARTGRIDLINKAFFQINAIVSFLLLIGVSCSLWIQK